MTPPRDFTAEVGSDMRVSQRRVLFVTRRTSSQVRAYEEERVQTFPEVLIRALLAVECLFLGLVLMSLFFNAPLEGIANPTNTPNPAKAPWYFLGLQEMLHYFPPVVAGVLIPGLLVISLIVIPYFDINIEAQGLFLKNRAQRLRLSMILCLALIVFLAVFDVYVALVPTAIVTLFLLLAAYSSPQSPSRFRSYLAQRPVSWWIMTWFLFQLIVLTAVGTFFRGPGWSWVLPWRS